MNYVSVVLPQILWNNLKLALCHDFTINEHRIWEG